MNYFDGSGQMSCGCMLTNICDFGTPGDHSGGGVTSDAARAVVANARACAEVNSGIHGRRWMTLNVHSSSSSSFSTSTMQLRSPITQASPLVGLTARGATAPMLRGRAMLFTEGAFIPTTRAPCTALVPVTRAVSAGTVACMCMVCVRTGEWLVVAQEPKCQPRAIHNFQPACALWR